MIEEEVVHHRLDYRSDREGDLFDQGPRVAHGKPIDYGGEAGGSRKQEGWHHSVLSAGGVLVPAVLLLAAGVSLPGWLVVFVFAMICARIRLRPAQTVDTTQLLDSTSLMTDEEFDKLLSEHQGPDGFRCEEIDKVYTELFKRMDPGYELDAAEMRVLHELLDYEDEGYVSREIFRRSIKLWYPPLRGKTALIMVDMQNDFVGGALPVPEGQIAIENSNDLRTRFKFDLYAHTRDWHPGDHCSFWDNHEGAEMYSIKKLQLPTGAWCDQMMWPRHCVQGSHGSKFHPILHIEPSDVIVSKGIRSEVDSYSGFFDNCHGTETIMRRLMFETGVSQIYVVGLALDYCVRWTAEDAASCGFESYLVSDCSRAVDSKIDMGKFKEEMEEKHVHVIDSMQVPMPRKFHGEMAMRLVRMLTKWRLDIKLAGRSSAQTPTD